MKRSVLAAAFLVLLATGARPAAAGWHDCAQPSSTGDAPTATDARAVLAAAVGIAGTCGQRPCVCDVSGDGKTSAADALRTLKKAVGQDVGLACDCPPLPPACTSATLTVLPGSELDLGWTGIVHDSELASGFSLEMNVVRRCTGNGAPCTSDQQCPQAGECAPSCDCNSDPTCELVAAPGSRRCHTTLAACTTNADCGSGQACEEFFGPPMPFSSGGTPTCRLFRTKSTPTATANLATGEFELDADLLERIHLGIALDQPCPRCGKPEDTPEVGDTFTCEGGQASGAACTVGAVHPWFGGTSFDCPPNFAFDTMGADRPIGLLAATTATTTRTAALPCASFAFRSNPLNAPANPGKCLDNSAACTSNADCLRCSGDAATVCATNGDCGEAGGSCAEAPDQPVSCGFWCNCGFCGGDATLPCFGDADCPEGKTCEAGPGVGTAANAPQQKPNDCSGDKFVCGAEDGGHCATTTSGRCSLEPYRSCASEEACATSGAGTCELAPRSCFGNRISRSGRPSPLGRYCASDAKPCSTNGDCTQGGDFCREDSALPETAGLACMPATSSSVINSAGGITGPAALTLRQRLVFHRPEPAPVPAAAAE